MRPTQSQPHVASAVGTIRQPMDRLCYVDPIVILATKRQTVYCGPNSDPFIQAPMFGYSYQNLLTIYLAFNFGNIFKIPFNTCSLHSQLLCDGI